MEENNIQQLDTFIKHSIFYKQERLVIRSNSFYYNIVDVFLILRDSFSKFTEIIEVNKFRFTCTQFCALVKAAKGVNKLKIHECLIFSDTECDFGEMKEWKIKTLNLHNWGIKSLSNWNDNIFRLENILIGIEKCQNLRESLQKVIITFFCADLDREALKDKISAYPLLKHIEFKF